MTDTSAWVDWHAAYDADTPLRRRLAVVQEQLRGLLDDAPPGEVRVVSLCAGQGRDLLPVLAGHPRREDVRARLVELDPHNAGAAAQAAAAAGLGAVEVVAADAALTSQYEGMVPAHLVVACGVFGNVASEDVARTIEHLPELCAPGAAVVWTRGDGEPDLRPTIRRWFAERGFEELFFRGEPGSFGVGVHRLAVEPSPFDPGRKLFTFVR